MATPIVVPGKEAGELFIPALGKTIKQVEWREDDFFDSVQLAAAATTAGATLEVFRDLANKNLNHTNLRTTRRIPAGSEMILSRVGVHVAQSFSNILPDDADVMKATHGLTLSFKLNDRLIVEGPLLKFPSGYGVTGSTTRNATGVVTIGVASVAAAPTLLVAQSIKDDDDLNAQIITQDTAWLATNTMPTMTQRLVFTTFLHGFIKKPQGR